MFLNFFNELREAKVPVTLKEYLLLMEAMVLEVYPQQEWVCKKGLRATSMYIVLSGTVSVVIDEDNPGGACPTCYRTCCACCAC